MKAIAFFRDKTEEELRQYMTDHGAKTETEQKKFLYQEMPKESVFQSAIMNALRQWQKDGKLKNAVFWKNAANEYSRIGIPDIMLLHNGRLFCFEVKRPYIGVATELQNKTMQDIRDSGGIAEIVSYVKDVRTILEREGAMQP